MIVESDAVVYPGAVMVEALNTVTANGTVAAATRADSVAVSTQTRAVYCCK